MTGSPIFLLIVNRKTTVQVHACLFPVQSKHWSSCQLPIWRPLSCWRCLFSISLFLWMEHFVSRDCRLYLPLGGPVFTTKFVYCVFQGAMRNDIPADAPESAHVWPVMTDCRVERRMTNKYIFSFKFSVAFFLSVLVPLMRDDDDDDDGEFT